MKPEGWPGEKQRHAMSSRGIQSKMSSPTRTTPTKKLLGENFEWIEMDEQEAFDLVDDDGRFVIVSPDDVWQAYKLEPTDNIVIILRVPYVDNDSPGVKYSYLTLSGTTDKFTDYNEDYNRLLAENSLRGAKWNSELQHKEVIDILTSGVLRGLAKREGFTEDDADPDQLKRGIKVEMIEHTDNHGVAKVIALDHLAEDPEYYDKLEEIGL